MFYDLPEASIDLALADLNEDGRLDVLLAGAEVVMVRLAAQTGGFEPAVSHRAVLHPRHFSALSLGVGDVNLDRHIDVVTGDADVLYGRGDGTFAFDGLSGFDFQFPADSPLVVDYSADGVPDILFVQRDGFAAMISERGGTNHPPIVDAGGDFTINYVHQESDEYFFFATGSDPDLHELRFEWRNQDGKVLSNAQDLHPGLLPPGRHTLTVTAFDERGGQASDSLVITVTPSEEIYFHRDFFEPPHGAWREQPDATAADGSSWRHPDAGAPKLSQPLASPTHYIETDFPADPTQAYKL